MTLPGVGVFSGENTYFLVNELRQAGFQDLFQTELTE